MKAVRALKLKLIDLIGSLKIYDVLQMFRQQQYMPLEELDRIRQKKLETLVSIAKESTIHYSKFEDFDALPVLTKNVINQNPSHFLSSFYKGKLIKKSTSGSTGIPFIYQTSTTAQSYLWAGLLLSWEVTGYRFGDGVAFIAGSALIKNTVRHSIFYRLMNIDLYPAAIMTNEVINGYIEMIRKKKTRLIYGYAMAINTIADHIIQHGIAPPPGLCGIVCTAEMLTDKVRANIEKAFGVKVFNQYGCNEAGVAGFECEQHHMHLISSRCIFETNKEDVLIGTDLANEAGIFLKYDTGDIVEFAEGSCNCGRSYPIIKKIVGRSADIIIDRSNKKIHCAYFNFLFKDDYSIKQYQVLFDERSIKINLMVNNNFSEKNRLYYMNSMKSNFDFEVYEITINEKFYTNSNLKHVLILDRRKHGRSTAPVLNS